MSDYVYLLIDACFPLGKHMWLKNDLFPVLLMHRHFKPLQKIETHEQNQVISLPANFSSKDPSEWYYLIN